VLSGEELELFPSFSVEGGDGIRVGEETVNAPILEELVCDNLRDGTWVERVHYSSAQVQFASCRDSLAVVTSIELRISAGPVTKPYDVSPFSTSHIWKTYQSDTS
jgi:hypothetical protein